MDNKAIARRLAALQKIADRGRPCKVVVTFTDGSSTTTDPAGAIDILREHGPLEDISDFTADRPEYAAAAGIMTVICHSAPNREVSDFE